MANGGKRPGAGRPKGHAPSFTEQAQAFRVALLDAVVSEQDAIIRGIVLNMKRGEYHTITEVLNRLLGRVKETHELSGVDGKPIQIAPITGMQIIADVPNVSTSNGNPIQEQKSETNTSSPILD